MSRQSADFETFVANRVIDFVTDHQREALYWAFDYAPGHQSAYKPFEHIELRQDVPADTADDAIAFPPLGEHEMKVVMGRIFSEDEGERDRSRMSVTITIKNGAMEVSDDDGVLPELLEDGKFVNDEAGGAYAANVILDMMMGFKADGALIPAGMRRQSKTDDY